MFKFEKLDVWQKAIEYADLIYRVTQGFPAEERFGLTSQLRRSERFGLTSQLRRSAVSISSNIAEGSSRSSDIDMARFIEIAYGSLLESVSELEIAKRQRFLKNDMFGKAYKMAEHLAKMLSGFRRSLKKRS